MSEQRGEDDLLDDVMDTHEDVNPHRRQHAKEDPRPDEDELDRKTNVERSELGLSEGDE